MIASLINKHQWNNVLFEINCFNSVCILEIFLPKQLPLDTIFTFYDTIQVQGQAQHVKKIPLKHFWREDVARKRDNA